MSEQPKEPQQPQSPPQIKTADSEQSLSANQKLKQIIRNMKNENKIDFVNTQKYTAQLKQIAADNNVKYTTAYKAFTEVKRESGNQTTKQSKTQSETNGGVKFNFTTDSGKVNAYSKELEKTKNSLAEQHKKVEQQIAIQQMQLASPVFDFYTNQNLTWMLTIRQMIQGFGANVAPEEQFKGIAQGFALKQMNGGLAIPSIVENILLIVGTIGVFVLPALPQIKKWAMSDDEDDKKKKEKKSDAPLAEIPEPTPAQKFQVEGGGKPTTEATP